MAYVELGTRVSLPSDKIPAGFTAPAVTPFSDAYFKHEFVLEIAKSAVSDADRATTLTDIITDSTNGLQKKVQTELATKIETTALDANVWTDFRNIDSNDKPANDNDFYTNAATKFFVTVIAYIKFTTPA